MLDLVYASGVKRGGTTSGINGLVADAESRRRHVWNMCVTPDLEVRVRLDVLEEIDSWQSAMPSSAARAERLYSSAHVDTKYPGA